MSEKLSRFLICYEQDFLDDVIKRINGQKDKFPGVIFVQNNKGQLRGVLTDSDIIKAISQCTDTHIPVSDHMNRNPIAYKESLPRSELLQEVRLEVNKRKSTSGKLVRYVPIIDEKQRILDIIDIYSLAEFNLDTNYTVCIAGLGFVGLTLAVKIASLGISVIGYDTNQELIDSLAEREVTVYEPRLKDMLDKVLDEKSLFLTHNSKDISLCNIYIISVGTPTKNDIPDLNYIKAALNVIGDNLSTNDLVMLRSTVPVGTTRNIASKVLTKKSGLRCGDEYYLAFTPERTVEGRAMDELSQLPQIVGGISKRCVEKSSQFWSNISNSVVPVSSVEAAEFVKLLNNSYRDLRFAFSNSFSLLADNYNLVAREVIEAANDGYPRDPIALPSPGVGGYCLSKDPYLYASTCPKEHTHSELASLGRTINKLSGLYPLSLANEYAERNNRSLETYSILIIGIAFKGEPQTMDLRGSSSIDLAYGLKKRGAKVYIYDHLVPSNKLDHLPFEQTSFDDSCNKCEIVMIMNNNPNNISDELLHLLNKKPTLLFDGWSQYDSIQVSKYKNICYSTMGFMHGREQLPTN
ncbi:nucleotide sugar dehydrogenase [Synechococcus sp. M16.1]|uniref:nucleotide sugar dehydrogenase n=1 Tax=Synechococcus sp. M16.1 TaxID=1442553 RepID=UPI00164871F3|nr:nucleotide sugar dehydrogenase [Synechococcus sp. M16.1]QNJ12219.1 UDP-glucose/GDP-mannose dehydrogenase family protein [Synechococcus sp. M16.1]